MWSTRLAGMAFWCFVGGSTDLYPRSCCCRIIYLCPDASRIRSPQLCIQKDADTSDTAALMVPWRSLDFFVALNWFFRTDTVSYNTRIILSLCGIMSSSLFLVPVYVRNVNSFPVVRLLGCSGFVDSFSRVKNYDSDNKQEIISLGGSLMFNDAAVCGGRMDMICFCEGLI